MRSVVGIVVPAYQAEQWLSSTLLSIYNQTYDEWYCVVVDDGSTDGTMQIAKAWEARDPRFKAISQSNQGVTAARNAGLKALPPVDMVSFVDSDDLLLPQCLSLLTNIINADRNAAGAYGLACYIDERGAEIPGDGHARRQRERHLYRGGRWFGQLSKVAPTADLTAEELVVTNPFWPPATGMVRKSAIDQVRGFDESYRVQEDWELWLRVVGVGPLRAIDQVVAQYRQRSGSLTTNDVENVVAQLRLRAERSRRAHDARAAGAWRALQVQHVGHLVWRAWDSVRRRDGRSCMGALAMVAFWAPQLVWPVPPMPGRFTTWVIRIERGMSGRG